MEEYLLNYFDKDLIKIVLNSKKYKRLIKQEKHYNKLKDIVNLEICKKLYIEYKLPIYKIAMLYGVSDVTIRNYFIKYNLVELKGHRIGKNSFNNYFETIDSNDKAYFLGLIIADGCLGNSSTKTNIRKFFSIELTEEDKYILEIFNQMANFNEKLIISHKKDLKPRYKLSISSSKIYDDLYALGVRERKSKVGTSIPNLKEKFIPHFIRGVFDGDGIAFSSGYIGFCGDYNLLNQIKEYLVNKGMKNAKIWFNKSNNIYYMQWSAIADRRKFFEIIYKDKENLYLKRKYYKILNKLK